MQNTEKMVISGTRFGSIEYESEDVLTFPSGLVGFPAIRSFLVLALEDNTPFRWLQSLDEPALAFLVVDPLAYVPDYAPLMPDADAEYLSLTADTPRLVLATASIPPGCPEHMTLNLAGPIVVNLVTNEARQVVLEDEAYTTRYRVFSEAPRAGGIVAA